jgi:hypothetical protein
VLVAARHVKVKNLGEVNEAALQYHVKQAIKIDQS